MVMPGWDLSIGLYFQALQPASSLAEKFAEFSGNEREQKPRCRPSTKDPVEKDSVEEALSLDTGSVDTSSGSHHQIDRLA
jgi:hypothetical protein